MKVLLLIGSLLVCMSILANEKGNGTSGGGASVVCRDRDNNILSAELLDTFEATYLYNLDIVHSSEDVDVQIQNALDKFSSEPFYKYTIIELIEHVKKRFQFLPDGISLNAPSDLGEADGVLVRDGCRLEGLGFYNSDGNLRVALATYNHLSKTDQAAFLLHEALYLYYRGVVRRNTSEISRQMNAMLFSNNTASPEAVVFFKDKLNIKKYQDYIHQILLPSDPAKSGKLIVKLTPSNLLTEYQIAYNYNNFLKFKEEYFHFSKGALILNVEDDVAPLLMFQFIPDFNTSNVPLKFNISIFRDDLKIYEIKDYELKKGDFNTCTIGFAFVHRPI